MEATQEQAKIDVAKPVEVCAADGRPVNIAVSVTQNNKWLHVVGDGLEGSGLPFDLRGHCLIPGMPWRIRNIAPADAEGHTPTPAEPVKGIKLWQHPRQDTCRIDVDDVPGDFGYIDKDDKKISPGSVSSCKRKPCEWMPTESQKEALRAFRDRIRVERAEKAKVGEPPLWVEGQEFHRKNGTRWRVRDGYVEFKGALFDWWGASHVCRTVAFFEQAIRDGELTPVPAPTEPPAPEAKGVKAWTFETIPELTMRVRTIKTNMLMVAHARPDHVVAHAAGGVHVEFTYEEFAEGCVRLDGSPCGIVD